MSFKESIQDLRQLLFLTLFFKKDWFAFRYPMNLFFEEVFSEERIKKEWERYNLKDGGLQLYIHSIFCDTRCSYCDCESLVRWWEKDIQLYDIYLQNEIRKYSEIIKKPLDSLYFWGGTFNLRDDKNLEDFCKKIRESFIFSENYRWQVEIHPFYLTKNTLPILSEYGVTDIMLGIQTTSQKTNTLNNRNFSQEALDKAIDQILYLPFKKVSFDILYNLPFQTKEDTIADLEYIVTVWEKCKSRNIDINLEINRWDISMKTIFANKFLQKWNEEKFFEICKYYISQSKKMVPIIDEYIDKRLLWLFDTHREEIEERKYRNTAILGFWLSATSYIPGVMAYEDASYSGWKEQKSTIVWYNLCEIDNSLSFISGNLRRGIPKEIFNTVRTQSPKFEEFYNTYTDEFRSRWDVIFMDVHTDYENDLLNLYFIDNTIRERQYEVLKNTWIKFWFTIDDLDKYSSLFLGYYYDRNKLYG